MNSTRKRQMTACCLLLATLLFSGVATAQEEPAVQVGEPMAMSTQSELIFELRAPTHYATDNTFDALSDDNAFSGGMLGVGYALGDLLPGLRAHALYFGGGESTRRFDGAVDFVWERFMFMAAADWGPEFYGMLRPSVRLGAGYALQHLDIETTGATKHDYAHDLAGLASVGLEAFTPRGFWGRVRLGFLAEFGYLAQTTATFDEFEADNGEDDPWTRDQTSLGDLHTSGLFWDLGLGLRIEL